MISPKLISGDLAFENGELTMVEGREELAQCCEIVVSTNKGEWWLDPDYGLDFGVFQGKGVTEDEMRDELASTLLQEPRIQTVDEVSFQLDRPARKLNVSFSATGTEGERVSLEVDRDAG